MKEGTRKRTNEAPRAMGRRTKPKLAIGLVGWGGDALEERADRCCSNDRA